MEIKNEKRAHNFLKMVAEKLKISEDEAYEIIGFKLQKELGTMYEGFLLAKDSKEELRGIVDEETVNAMEEIAKENIKTKEIRIKGKIKLKCYEPDAIDVIKRALTFEEEDVHIHYVSAPEYELTLKGTDYLELEKRFKEIDSMIQERLKNTKHEFSLTRIES